MKILVVSWSFPPIPGPRAIKAAAIASELMKLGHDVSIITRGDSTNFPHELVDRAKRVEFMNPKESRILPVDLSESTRLLSRAWFSRKINGALYRFFCYPAISAFFKTVVALRKFRGEAFDATISVDGPQPLHWAVARSRGRRDLDLGVWIADCGDPLLRGLPGNMPAGYFKIIENKFVRAADVITVPVRQGVDYFERRHANKIFTVPHSLVFPSKRPKPEIDRAPSATAGNMRIGYAGNLSPYRDKFFDFISALPRTSGCEFHIFGENAAIIGQARARFPDKRNLILERGAVSRGALLPELPAFDFLVLFAYESGIQVPFKTIDYSFSGRPILLFESRERTTPILNEFLSGDFRNEFEAPDFERYAAENTVPQYISLIERLR